MKALNLSTSMPRGPRVDVDGIVFLARSIDKMRADLPGGDLGGFRLGGLTERMLETFGLPLEWFRTVVSVASSDADVASAIRDATSAEKIAAWNDYVCFHEPRGGNRAEAAKVIPWLAERPDLILGLDILEEDDRRYAAGRGQ